MALTVARRPPRLRVSRAEWCVQGLIAGLVAAYFVSTLLVRRPPSGYDTLWDGWVYTIAELLPVIPITICARQDQGRRAAWAAMAAHVVLYTAGDLVYTFHDQNMRPVPDPAPSDVLYLLSYAACIVAVAALTQASLGGAHPSARLDGAIAGLATAAAVAM